MREPDLYALVAARVGNHPATGRCGERYRRGELPATVAAKGAEANVESMVQAQPRTASGYGMPC